MYRRAVKNRININQILTRSQEGKRVEFTPEKPKKIFDDKKYAFNFQSCNRLFERLDIKYPIANKRNELRIKLANFNSASKNMNKSVDLMVID